MMKIMILPVILIAVLNSNIQSNSLHQEASGTQYNIMLIDKHLTPSPTNNVGVTKVRQGFSIPPYGNDGGKISKS